MNVHVSELKRQQDNAKQVRSRIFGAPPAIKVVHTADYYLEMVSALKHVNSVLREELDAMKKVIRQKDGEISALKFEVAKWEGEPEEAVLSMREICEAVLAEHHPHLVLRNIFADDRRVIAAKARNHCFYEVFIARPDVTIALKSKFFQRDHSSFRRGVKLHAASIGIHDILLSNDARAKT